jgi:hypothetical protein
MSQPDIVTISSYNSGENQTSGNFESSLANTIVGCKRFIITKFVMPNLMGDISPFYNRIFLGVYNDVTDLTYYPLSLTLEINTHWPTGQAFANYLQTLVSALLFDKCEFTQVEADKYSVTYNSLTGKLTFSSSSMTNGCAIWFVPWNLNFDQNNNLVVDSIGAKSALYKMGFGETNPDFPGYSQGTQLATLNASSPLNLLSTAIIYVSSSLLGNANNDYRGNDGTPAGNESIICAIPTSAPYGNLIIYQDQFSHFIDTNINSIRTIKFQLLDEDYNEISVPRNCYCTIELRMLY